MNRRSKSGLVKVGPGRLRSAATVLLATGDARMLRSTKTQIDRRFQATGRAQTQARLCRPRPDVGGRKHALVALRRAAISCDGTQ